VEAGPAAGKNAGVGGFIGIGCNGGGGGNVVASLRGRELPLGARGAPTRQGCGAVRTRWRSGSWLARSRRVALIAAQARVALSCFSPPSPSVPRLLDGWHLAPPGHEVHDRRH